ncbi:peptidoglycan hydrolase-like protein with peptidoglycan-binding domain [Virgibacillus natechei]|uniref:N-acetylmuramoyl-L-alanine amidase n=1 Tax=Virgibacillus natechei TaxID=1216297 RepID=A0ABS4IJX6_9BACI|nr:peptidoglycan-binding protein [Virgibacillus natechei]MBP1970314.1 peptidoglycan hydrolase-like protein with peptidoglycan-binding domain [Virgibacillus natechei]UZD13142.1 peptidoglycan-binding protein [Virgibacillus natechei]
MSTGRVLRLTSPYMQGEDVRELQQALVDNNFYPDVNASDYGVDGVYGPDTEDAVRRYQTVQGLEVDGIAGQATLASLGVSSGGTGGTGGNVLQRGDSGSAVRELQQALVDNNFYPDVNASDNGVDGVYGPDTEDAVRRYQTIQGLEVDGIAGPATLGSLGLSSGGTGGTGGSGGSVLQRGDSGSAVRELQQALVDNNFYPDVNASDNGVDGVYGPDTEDAVRRYQTIEGLEVDGIAGPETLGSLGLSSGGTGGNVLQRGDSGSAVRELQQALVDNNFYPDVNASDNGVDGVYGPDTEDAVRRYQTIEGLEVDGIAGPETLGSLGLSNSGGTGGTGGTGGSDGGYSIGGDMGHLTVVNDIIPRFNGNRPSIIMTPQYITIHETANTDVGANAAMHANYVKQPGTAVSWHFTVDDGNRIYQHLPTYETGYHAGDGSGDGNRNSIGIELCVNSDGYFLETRRNAAALVKKLMTDFAIPISNVVPHNHWSGKNCPANLLSVFDDFLAQVENSSYEEPEVYSPDSVFTDKNPFLSPDTPEYDYDITVGGLTGTLTGTLVLDGDVPWTIAEEGENGESKVLHSHELDDGMDKMLNIMKEHYGLNEYGSIQEARTEIEGILGEVMDRLEEVRIDYFTDFEATWDPPFLNTTYIKMEILYFIPGSDAKLLETVSLDEIDYDNNRNRGRPQTGLVLVLVLLAVFALVALGLTMGSIIAAIIALLFGSSAAS